MSINHSDNTDHAARVTAAILRSCEQPPYADNPVIQAFYKTLIEGVEREGNTIHRNPEGIIMSLRRPTQAPHSYEVEMLVTSSVKVIVHSSTPLSDNEAVQQAAELFNIRNNIEATVDAIAVDELPIADYSTDPVAEDVLNRIASGEYYMGEQGLPLRREVSTPTEEELMEATLDTLRNVGLGVTGIRFE